MAATLVRDAVNLGATTTGQLGGRYLKTIPRDVTATDGSQNPALFIYSSSDRIDSATTVSRESILKMSTSFDPVEVSRGVNNPAYVITTAPPMATIEAVDTLLLRNIGVNGTASIVSTVGPTDKINRMEMTISDNTVNFLKVSGVNPNDPDNLLGGIYTPIANAVDGATLTGVKELRTKNVLSSNTSYLIQHDNTASVNTFKLQKDVGGVISTIAIFK